MKDYIEREQAITVFKTFYGRSLRVMLEALEEEHAADVRPVVRGKWVPDYDYAEYDFDGSTPLPEPRKFQDGWKCSLCGGYMPSEANFCPNCGADMREKL